jgi:lysyl-tRNA synthetase class I
MWSTWPEIRFRASPENKEAFEKYIKYRNLKAWQWFEEYADENLNVVKKEIVDKTKLKPASEETINAAMRTERQAIEEQENGN